MAETKDDIGALRKRIEQLEYELEQQKTRRVEKFEIEGPDVKKGGTKKSDERQKLIDGNDKVDKLLPHRYYQKLIDG